MAKFLDSLPTRRDNVVQDEPLPASERARLSELEPGDVGSGSLPGRFSQTVHMLGQVAAEPPFVVVIGVGKSDHIEDLLSALTQYLTQLLPGSNMEAVER